MTRESGLVWVSRPQDAINDSEVLALEDGRKFKADAIYFRRFEKTSIPQVYIYEREFEEEDLVGLHRDLWSSGVVPFFYTVTKTQVKIYNCTKSVQEIKKRLVSTPIKVFSLVGDVQQKLDEEKYSAKLFDNGTFWEIHKDLIDIASSPYQRLLDGLLRAKKDLEKKDILLSPTTISKILIIGILVRYLEEKQDENGTNLLEISRDFYHKFPGSSQFTDILRNGQVNDFLKELHIKFNGKIFNLSETEESELASANLEYVAAIFDANIEGRQFVLWRLYAFNHLPIELISGIYEAFLKKEKGVVYTPPFLVNALIDECMPLYKAEAYFKDASFKVLDPACGSGIFLVAALKRMLQWKAILHHKETGKVEYPDLKAIQQITKDNIFGVDIEEGATLISIFSLCIALCEKLSPMQIWKELRFEDLGAQNIRTVDFFKVFKSLPKENYDLVIGNPPFNPPSGFTNKSYVKYVKDEYGVEPSHALNDDNLALFFWDKAIELCKKDRNICFVLPAGAWLYNNNSLDYRAHFFKKYEVHKVIDFTHLSESMFHGSADPAVCVTIASNVPSAHRDLLHIVVKRSKVTEERFFFEIDHYDFHKVKYQTATENPYIWKSNLLGGGRLIRLVNYLSSLRNLGAFLEEKKADGWVWGEGYIVAGGKDPADWITGKPTVYTDAFNEKGIGRIDIESATGFYRSSKSIKEIFQPPHILIKENLGINHIPMAFSEEHLCFKHEIFGIHAPKKEELALLYKTLRNQAKYHRLFVISTSSRLGVSRSNSTLLKKDIMNLPYPENPDDLALGFSDAIVQDDVLNFYLKSNTSSEHSPLNQPATAADLKAYGDVFCKILNPIYEQNEQKWFVGDHQVWGNLVAYVFCFGKPAKDISPQILGDGFEGIERLLYNKNQRNVRITRVLREYLHIDSYDILLLVKPQSLRYWLKSIALRDADETFSDLKRTGF